MTENPYENLFGRNAGSDNTDTPQNADILPSQADIQTSDTQLSETSDAAQPADTEYSVVYSDVRMPSDAAAGGAVPDSADSVVSDAADPLSSSCEWYGGNVISDIPAPTTVQSAPYSAPYSAKNDEERPKKKVNRRMPTAVLLIICILISSVCGVLSATLTSKLLNDKKPSSGLTINQISPDSDEDNGHVTSELSTVDIVEKTADSVVEIITEYVETGVFAQQYIKSGAGSGVIIDGKGYIITNHHVIESAQKITVTLRSGESFSAELIGSDSQMDLALLKIDADNLTPAVFGNSDNLKVGQKTVAIGNPLGQLGGSVTEGVLSALDRDVVVDDQSMNLLQTDTAINPGNSGGGLFDGQGNLIGVVVAKSSGSEVEGLGFAIPVNDAVDVISDLMDYGYVRGRVDVGMEFIDVSSIQIAWMYGLSELGCYVYSVDEDSNAAKAGFRSGDLVLSVDGESVKTTDDIERVLQDKAVGDEVVFSLRRGNSEGEVTLTLEEYKPDVVIKNEDGDDSIIWR